MQQKPRRLSIKPCKNAFLQRQLHRALSLNAFYCGEKITSFQDVWAGILQVVELSNSYDHLAYLGSLNQFQRDTAAEVAKNAVNVICGYLNGT